MVTEEILPAGEKLRKAVKWIAEETQLHPEKSRKEIVLEAERIFDLPPKDCEFLQRKFLGDE